MLTVKIYTFRRNVKKNVKGITKDVGSQVEFHHKITSCSFLRLSN